MNLKRGDLVTRKSYNHDTIFKITNIKNDIYYLKGVEVRLYADSDLKDLVKYIDKIEESDDSEEILLDRNEYFYLPGKVLHIDGDKEYLEKCLKYYKKNGILAIGKKISEDHIYETILPLLNEYKPDIIIITGHDAYYSKKGDINNLKNYRNTSNFIKAVKVARKYEKSHDKLVIIAGACQSNYEELIKAGANFASSPKRTNIHALDPAIIASTLALTERNKEINLIEMLNKTKYGHDGMGGIKCNGLMYVGYPRQEEILNINIVKDEILENINKPVEIKVYGMRNKVNSYKGIIKAIYPNIFTIIENNSEKSFSYADIITGDIKIKYL